MRRAGVVTSPPQGGLFGPQPPKTVIQLAFLSKSRPGAWAVAVLVFQRSSAPLGARNEQPAIPGTGRAALGMLPSSSPGLFP